MNTFKKVLNLSFAALLLCITSCVSDDFLAVTEPETQNEGNPLTLTVTQESPSGTRLALQSDGLTTMWEPGDQLVLIDKARLRNPIYLNCTLTSPDTKATFESDGGVPADDYWVIYNYNENLVYRHQGFATIDEINDQDKMVLYGELTVAPGATSAELSLKHLYAKLNIKLENAPVDDTQYTIGMYSSKKGFPLSQMFTPNGLVNAEYGQDPNNPSNRSETYYQSYRRDHNISFGSVPVDQLESKSVLILPEDLSGEEVFFYVIKASGAMGQISDCYEIKKEIGKVKLEAGMSYTVVLDLSSAATSSINNDGEISSVLQWRHAAYRTSKFDFLYRYKLASDLNFEGDYFFPICADKIDGNGKTLKNINLDWNEDNVGLYRIEEEVNEWSPKRIACTITNLTLENVTFKGKSYVGAFGGHNVSAENCSVIGESVIFGTGNYVGGIVGWNNLGETQSSIITTARVNLSDVSVGEKCEVSGANYVGGIVGAYQEYESVSLYSHQKPLNDCESSATVVAKENYAGGIFGKIGGSMGIPYTNYMNDYTYTLKKCINHGDITGKDYVGGIGGEFALYANSGSDEQVLLSHSQNDGEVSGEMYVGGILGSNYAALNTCYSINKITGTDNVGGIIGFVNYTPSSHIINCFSISTLNLVGTGSCSAGGIIGNSSNAGGIVSTNGPTIKYCYFSGENPQGSGIIGNSDGTCTITNCLTTLASFGTQNSAVTNSELSVQSIKGKLDVINANGNNAYSENVWPNDPFESVMFAGYSADVESPGFGNGGNI